MNIAVIFAGGVGKRMRTVEKPKQFIEINNKPIIIYTLEHFENNDEIDAIVIACLESWIPYLKELIEKFNIKKVKKIVPGGETGQLSIYNGLCAAKEISKTDKDIVLIHDGVRPLINSSLLTKNIECVKENGSSITAGIVKETIVNLLILVLVLVLIHILMNLVLEIKLLQLVLYKQNNYQDLVEHLTMCFI